MSTIGTDWRVPLPGDLWRLFWGVEPGGPPVLSNLAARDVETLIHPYTNLARFRETGPLVLERGEGVWVYDTDGKRYIEGMAGLWCTALGYSQRGARRGRARADGASCPSRTCSRAAATIRRSSWPRS